MASVEELLLKSLNELDTAELKEFQWHLVNDHECISRSDMENADRLKTVDKMAARFGAEEAVKITVNILRKMNQNNLAEQLEKKHKEEVYRRRNMASVEELVKKSLNELDTAELKEFQWHLKYHECISKSEMENADRLDTVDKMAARFGAEEAVKITVDILRKMNQNNLAEQLEKKHKEVSPWDIEPYPVGNNSDAHTTGSSNLKSVSTAAEKDELRLNTEAEKATFFDDNWPDLIQRVQNFKIIADKLRQQKIIHPEQYSEILYERSSQESMRKICAIIDKHSAAVKAKFISILQKEERCLLEHWFD